MKRKDLSEVQRLTVLEHLASGKSQEVTAEATRHRKAKIGEVLRKFREMSWEEARALCDNNQKILALRGDYLEKMVAEAEELKARLEKEYEESLKENILQIRHELNLPLTYSYIKDGYSTLEF